MFERGGGGGGSGLMIRSACYKDISGAGVRMD